MKPGLYVTLPFTYAYTFDASGTGFYVYHDRLVHVVTETEVEGLGGLFVKAIYGDKVLYLSKETLRKL